MLESLRRAGRSAACSTSHISHLAVLGRDVLPWLLDKFSGSFGAQLTGAVGTKWRRSGLAQLLRANAFRAFPALVAGQALQEIVSFEFFAREIIGQKDVVVLTGKCTLCKN